MGVSLKIPEAAELTRIQSMKEEVVLQHRSHHPAARPDAYRGEHIQAAAVRGTSHLKFEEMPELKRFGGCPVQAN